MRLKAILKEKELLFSRLMEVENTVGKLQQWSLEFIFAYNAMKNNPIVVVRHDHASRKGNPVDLRKKLGAPTELPAH